MKKATGARTKMTRLRVIHTPVRFFPAYGGVETYVLELSRKFVELGHEVTVICADEPKANCRFVDGVKIVRLPYFTKIANTNITLRLFRTMMAEKFDVVHTHIPTPWSADISALVSLLKRKPLIVTYHNDIVGEGTGSILASIYNRTLLHLVLIRARTIIITQPKYLAYSGHLRLYRSKIAVIPPGVRDLESAGTQERRPNQIFFLSILDKYHEYKGLDILLKAVAGVKDRNPHVRLLVGGAGELVEKYRQVSRDLKIDGIVEFLGFLSDEALAEVYSSSAVFVLPSINNLEGFGSVALEALSYGTPVITTNLTGSADFIARNNAGMVVPSGDVGALASALELMLDDDTEAVRMGARGARAVRANYSWLNIAKQVVDLYSRR